MTKRNSENRVNHNTTIDDDLWTRLRFISISKKDNMNDLLEEGIEYLIERYEHLLPKEMRTPKSSTKKIRANAK